MTTIESILHAVAKVNYVKRCDVTSVSRKRELVFARYQAAAMLNELGLSLQRIATVLGRDNHSSIIHALDMHEDLLITKRLYREAFYEAKSMINTSDTLVISHVA